MLLVASKRAGRPLPSCDGGDDAEGGGAELQKQNRKLIEWAMTGFLPSGPQSLDPPDEERHPYKDVYPEMWVEPEEAYTPPPPTKRPRKNVAEKPKIREVIDEGTRERLIQEIRQKTRNME
ncbi:DNA (cytosine-5)-methyltransferase 3A-like, partial [Salvelinus sp. IW2-2015]|uniref:DNA (cytosine-5)-methyltransferase 3A-like n=1 Tax=Salvelinus sp. IW2-2015 TaxID=2691554 RepID=UPI0038D4C9BA